MGVAVVLRLSAQGEMDGRQNQQVSRLAMRDHEVPFTRVKACSKER